MKNWQVVDLVRAFSIIAVMADHSYTNPPFARPWMAWLWGRFCVNGSNGVLIFFLVSGFLITNVISRTGKGLFRPDILRFYIHRIGRIWPLYFLIFFAGVFTLWVLPEGNGFHDLYFPNKTQDPWFWLSVPTFTFNWYYALHPDVNLGFPWLVLWSLAIEEQFYLFYPLILKWAKGLRNFLKALGFLLAAGVLFRVLLGFFGPINNYILSYPTPAEFDLFVFGSLLFIAAEKFGPFLRKRAGWSWSLCLSGLALALWAYMGVYPKRTWGIALFPDILGLGVFGFLLGALQLSFFESRKWMALALPGKYCYGNYLFHAFVLFWIGPFLRTVGPFGGLFIFVAVTTALSACSYHFFELPVNRSIRGHFDGRPGAKRRIHGA